jgi:hypothetical protein
METRAGAVISTQFSTLPDDFLEMRNIQVNSQPVIALKYVTPQHADEIRATNLQGKPQFFSVVANRLELIPAPSGPYDVEMVYYSKVPALTSQTTSNWLSSAHPDVYLYGCLAQASLFLDKDASAWVTLYDSAVSEMYMENERSQFHGTTPCVRGIRIG